MKNHLFYGAIGPHALDMLICKITPKDHHVFLESEQFNFCPNCGVKIKGE